MSERDRARVNPCPCLEARASVGSLLGRGEDIGTRVRDGGEGEMEARVRWRRGWLEGRG